MKVNILFLVFFLTKGFLSMAQTSSVFPKREMRGLWITSAYNLDWPSSASSSAKKQKAEFIEILEKHEKKHLNTIFLQIRVSADALYDSQYEPWSKVLTGKRGKKPNYDPLQFAIEECHKRNIELHAWFNVFRGAKSSKKIKKDKNHIVKKHPNWFLKTKAGYYFNPGKKEATDYLKNVVIDLVKKYDVDGIHFDDYFYPQEINKVKINDSKLWKKYQKSGGNLSLKDWRRDNINQFIKQISIAIKKEKPYLKFGISPVAVWRHKDVDENGSPTQHAMSSYDDLYGDSRKWLKEEWIDYLVPQLYQSTEYPHAGFKTMIEWWDSQQFSRHLYIGHAIYKLNTEEKGWINNPLEIKNQLLFSRKHEHIKGNAFFRASNFNRKTKEFEKILETELYPYIALVPRMPWLDNIPPNSPKNLYIKRTEKGIFLTWSPPTKAADNQTAHSFLIYRVELNLTLDFEHPKFIIAQQKETSFLDMSADPNINYLYFITALDRLGNESDYIGASVGKLNK